MNVPKGHTELTTRNLVLVSTFLVVAGVTTALFAQAVTGHLASMHAESADATVVGYDVTEDGALDLTVRVHNPTVKEFEFRGARMNVYVDGEQVTDGTTASVDGVTVGAGETKRVVVPLDLREDGPDRLRNADAGRVEASGQLIVYVVDERINVPLDGMEVGE